MQCDKFIALQLVAEAHIHFVIHGNTGMLFWPYHSHDVQPYSNYWTNKHFIAKTCCGKSLLTIRLMHKPSKQTARGSESPVVSMRQLGQELAGVAGGYGTAAVVAGVQHVGVLREGGGTGLGHVAVQALQHMTAKNIRSSAAFSMRR